MPGYTEEGSNAAAYRPSKKKEEQYMNLVSVADVQNLPMMAIPERSITKATVEHFGVKTELDGGLGTEPIAHYFPYTEDQKRPGGSIEKVIIGYKKRDLTKHKKVKGHFTTVGVVKPDAVDLFGTQNGNNTGGNKVFITEGEYDAMICYQVLKGKWPKLNPTVLSIGFGTASAVKHIGQKHCTRYLKKFKETVIAFDNDKASIEEKSDGIMKGKEATAAVYGLMPECKVAQLPEGKDPCEMYDLEGSEQLYWTLVTPINYKPEGFITYNEIREKALEMPILGKGWPWPTLFKKTLGRRLGEGYYIGAGVKAGKSEFANKLIEYIVKNETDVNGDPQKVAVFKFEEEPDYTVKKVAGKFYKKDFTNPEKVLFIDEDGREHDIYGNDVVHKESFFSADDMKEAVDAVGPNLIMYNAYGSCRWAELKGAIRHAVLVEHVVDIIIDPVSRLTSGMTASEANQELEGFADEISKMSKDLGFTYYCFSHLKQPTQGPLHEFGGSVQSGQFTGSRAMTRCTYYTLGIERNKDPELGEKVFNTSWLVILDDRKHGRTAKIPMWYDSDTGDYVESSRDFIEDDRFQTLKQWQERDQGSDSYSNEAAANAEF